MELTMLLVADYANVDQDGKVNVMGIFNQINAKTFPTIHPEMRVVFTLLASPAEAGEKRVTLRLIAEDGEPIFDWERTTNVPAQPGGKPTVVNQILRVTGIVFPRAGEYAFHVLVNGEERGSTPIYLTQLE